MENEQILFQDSRIIETLIDLDDVLEPADMKPNYDDNKPKTLVKQMPLDLLDDDDDEFLF